jgi:8-oxo-dGTP pyrophosphatase MutT (NUDIX family)
LPAPEQLVARARAAAAGHSAPDVPVRDAATVVLVRDGAEGPEVYLLRRHARMAFAPGQAVFPGGGVDPRDREVEVSWAGPPAAEWAVRLRCDGPTARGLICAAVRETFEESGVLLAGDAADTVVADTTGAEWEADRLALESREQSLADLLRRRGLVLRSDLLGAWAHWITPGFEPRRYDTRFFVAVLPAGQRTRDVSSESDAVAWMRPLDALDAVRDGRLAMMPPTEQTCVEIAELGCAADALPAAAARALVTVEPRLVVEGDDVWLELAGPDEELS